MLLCSVNIIEFTCNSYPYLSAVTYMLSDITSVRITTDYIGNFTKIFILERTMGLRFNIILLGVSV